MTPPTEQEITEAISRIGVRKLILEDYRDTCIAIADHHGVQDASSDLREVEAVLSAFAWIRGEGELRV